MPDADDARPPERVKHRFYIEVEVDPDHDNATDQEWWADAAAGAVTEYGGEATYTLEPPAPTGLTSLFQPYLYVDDDGSVTIDFSDSYTNTTGPDGEQVDDEDPNGHAAKLDEILGPDDGPSARLRRLADYIDQRAGVVTSIDDPRWRERVDPLNWPRVDFPLDQLEASGDADPTGRLSGAMHVRFGTQNIPMHVELHAVKENEDGIVEADNEWPADLDHAEAIAGEGRFMTIEIGGRLYVPLAYGFMD